MHTNFNYLIEVATSAVIVMKLIVPTRSRNTRVSCAPDGSRESVKCQVRQEACVPSFMKFHA